MPNEEDGFAGLQANNPVASAFEASASMTFDIRGLKERIVSMFSIREASLTKKVEAAIKQATSEEHIDAMIAAAVNREVREVFQREMQFAIQRKVEARFKTEEWKKKLAKHIAEAIESAEKYGV